MAKYFIYAMSGLALLIVAFVCKCQDYSFKSHRENAESLLRWLKVGKCALTRINLINGVFPT